MTTRRRIGAAALTIAIAWLATGTAAGAASASPGPAQDVASVLGPTAQRATQSRSVHGEAPCTRIDVQGYECDFPVGSVTPQQAWALLGSDFGRVFPVRGAPAALPVDGTDLRHLRAALLSADDDFASTLHWVCLTGSEECALPSYAGFQLDALPGNVAGEGSAVAFGFYLDRSGAPRLNVAGTVTSPFDDDVWATWLERSTATWQSFAAAVERG